MGAFVVSLTFAVVVFTALYIQNKPVEAPDLAETFLPQEEIEAVDNAAIDWVEEEVIEPEAVQVISFAKAYAIARETLGPDQIFTWNGNQYSTNTAEENANVDKTTEPALDLAEIQDSLNLSHALTP